MSCPRTLEQIEAVTSRVDGWLSEVEGRLLYDLAYDADPDGVIVEIGSWQGKSTIWLASGAKAGRGARVVAIDPHQGSALHASGENTELALRANLEEAGVSDQVDVVVGTSEDVAASWTRPISLLWIDGDHAYESVKRDFLLWEGHVLDGGVLALHDTLFWEGPGRVVAEYVQRLDRFGELRYAHTITYATMRHHSTLRQRARKRISIVRRYAYGVRVRAYADNRFHFRDLFDRALEAKRAARAAVRRGSSTS
jgi:predicted O-methyltransferase YrrM